MNPGQQQKIIRLCLCDNLARFLQMTSPRCKSIGHREENAVRGTIDFGIEENDTFIMNRKHLYSSVYRLHKMNQSLGNQASNLHAILYAQYCTQRFMFEQSPWFVRENNNSARHDIRHERDLAFGIEMAFADLLKNDGVAGKHKIDIKSREDLEAKYLEIVKKFDPALAVHHDTLHEYVAKEDFIMGADQTNAYLEEKLSKDLEQLMPRSQRVMHWMRDNQLISGWITSLVVLSLGLSFLS